jgi:hypothetical protein
VNVNINENDSLSNPGEGWGEGFEIKNYLKVANKGNVTLKGYPLFTLIGT